MIRLVCSITIASSLLLSAQAIAQGQLEWVLRVRNETSSLVRSATLCAMTPRAINAQPLRWEPEPTGQWHQREGRYCRNLNAFGPYQAQQVRIRWLPHEGSVRQESNDYPISPAPSAELQALARSFSTYPQASRPERIFEWMVANIEFSGIRRGVDGAEHALLQRKGDCTEHMLLAGELLERNGIRVRRVLGIAKEPGQELAKASDLHNWLEYEDNQSWRIFDSSRRRMDTVDGAEYIALFYYQHPQQLALVPVETNASALQLYME